MCLTVKEHTRRYTASRDIEVFKVLDPDGKSPYHSSPYKRGRTKRAKLEQAKPSKWGKQKGRLVNRGLHAYVSRYSANRFATTIQRYYGTPVQIFRMVIPKGAEYYRGVSLDTVSSQLRWPA